MTDLYTYAPPTRPLRDWLKLQPGPFSALVAGPGVTARIYATETGGLLPGGIKPSDGGAVAFHATPGSIFDNTLHTQPYQFDCYSSTPEAAEDLAAALGTLLASTPPATRVAEDLVLQGPAVIIDSFYLPVNLNRVARQILRARLTFTAF